MIDEWNSFFLNIIGVGNDKYNDSYIENTVDRLLTVQDYSATIQFVDEALMFLPSSPKLQFFKGLLHIMANDRYCIYKYIQLFNLYPSLLLFLLFLVLIVILSLLLFIYRC